MLDEAPEYTTGDVVGCGFDIVNNVVFFTKNGRHLGKSFDVPQHPAIPLYPTVGMQSNGGRITANFWNSPCRLRQRKVRDAKWKWK